MARTAAAPNLSPGSRAHRSLPGGKGHRGQGLALSPLGDKERRCEGHSPSLGVSDPYPACYLHPHLLPTKTEEYPGLQILRNQGCLGKWV